MKHRLRFAGLSLLLSLVTVGSLLLTPAATQSRRMALPPHAQVVYSQDQHDRFPPFFPTIGNEWAVFAKVWNQVFPTAGKWPLAMATVPFGGLTQRPCRVSVSEPGAPAALALRWRLTFFPPEGVSRVRPYAVWPVWKFEHPSLPSWARVRFTITESLLICSVSADSHDMYRLLDVADGRVDSMEAQRR